jgi:hypothetical protein
VISQPLAGCSGYKVIEIRTGFCYSKLGKIVQTQIESKPETNIANNRLPPGCIEQDD